MPVGGALLRRRSSRIRSEVCDASTKLKIHPEDRDAWTKLSKKIVQKTRSGKIEGVGRHEEEPNGLQP